MKSCQESWHELEQVVMRSSCEGLAHILEESLHDLVQVLVRRSCGDLGEVLPKKS